MKRIFLYAAMTAFCLCSFQIARTQTQLCNQSDHDINLVYEGVAIPVPANSVLFWPEAPSGQFIAYIYRYISDIEDTSSRVVEKYGFVALENENELIIFDRFRRPLPVLLANHTSKEMLIEYSNLAVFIQPGATVSLSGVFITPTGEATVLISECRGDFINPPQPVLLSFKTSPDGLRAEIK
jgi:hypothetical protein